MFVFLDSADRAQIEYWVACGVIDGVTTNPLIMVRDGVANDRDTLASLAEMIGPQRALHAAATAVGVDELLAQAREVSGIADNVVVKVPVVAPRGEPRLAVIAELRRSGVRVNATVCLSIGQVVLAAKAGAEFVSVLVGRIDDEGGGGSGVVSAARQWIDRWGIGTKIVAASLLSVADVQRCWDAGADCVTVAPEILGKLIDHKNARHTAREFLDAAAQGG